MLFQHLLLHGVFDGDVLFEMAGGVEMAGGRGAGYRSRKTDPVCFSLLLSTVDD